MGVRCVLLGLLAVLAVGARAETASLDSPLPFIRYFGTVAGDELFTQLKGTVLFRNLSQEVAGSPLVLRVTHSLEPTAGGKAAGLASAIWTGGTLGLLPVVTKNDLIITYEILVNGTVLTSYAYRKHFTRAVNIWAKDTTYGLGKEGLSWAKDTALQFANAANGDFKLAELVAEYRFYFDPEPSGAEGNPPAAR